MLRRGFTLLEILTVIAIIGLIAAIIFPLFLGAIEKAKIAETKDEVMRLTAIFDNIKQIKGTYPVPESDFNLSWDPSGDNPGILNQIVEPHNFAISLDRLDSSGHFMDPWDSPFKYVKGNYENRIERSKRDPDVDTPQDTNKPIGNPTTDIASESDWNPDNVGGYAYIWSYGGFPEDSSKWLYKTR